MKKALYVVLSVVCIVPIQSLSLSDNEFENIREAIQNKDGDRFLEAIDFLGRNTNQGFRPYFDPAIEMYIDSQESTLIPLLQRLMKTGVDLKKVNLRFTEDNGEFVVMNALDLLLLMSSDNVFLDDVKFLIENGANVNIAESDGWTPLHIAAENDNLPTVKYLLMNKANKNARTLSGYLPADLTTSKKIKSLLLL